MEQTKEIEIKLKVLNPESLEFLRRNLMHNCDAVCHKQTRSITDTFYDRCAELRLDNKVLRIRTDNGYTGLITFKAPSGIIDGVKTRTELQTTVGDRDAMEAILEQLGYKPLLSYSKMREDFFPYIVGINEVAIDSVEGFGDFIEIEGESVEVIKKAIGDIVDLDGVRYEIEERSYFGMMVDRIKEQCKIPSQKE